MNELNIIMPIYNNKYIINLVNAIKDKRVKNFSVFKMETLYFNRYFLQQQGGEYNE